MSAQKYIPKIQSCFTVVNEKKVHYLTSGSGSPLVLLHGYLTNAETFIGLIEYLAQHYTVYAPDLPGFGKSESLSNNATIRDNAHILAQWIKSMELRDILLTGISMGGATAVYVGEEADEHIKGYILIEPFLNSGSLVFSDNTLKGLKAVSLFFNKVMPKDIGETIWSTTLPLRAVIACVDKDYKKRSTEQIYDIAHCASYQTIVHTFDTLLHTDVEKEGVVSHKPALLLMSSSDKSLDYQKVMSGYRQLFPNLQNVPMEPTEHYPTQPLTLRYFETHYPKLLKTIIADFDSSPESSIKSFFGRFFN